MPHYCHAIGCPVPVPPRLLMCRRHWRMVPPNLQRDVWRTYRVGQELDKQPSLAYCLAQVRAVNAVALAEGKMSAEMARSREEFLEDELLMREGVDRAALQRDLESLVQRPEKPDAGGLF